MFGFMPVIQHQQASCIGLPAVRLGRLLTIVAASCEGWQEDIVTGKLLAPQNPK